MSYVECGAVRRSALLILSAAVVTAAPVFAQPDADRAYRSATGLLNRGMHELAADEYRSFLSKYPASVNAVVARYALGICLSRMGDHAGACDQLDDIASTPTFEFAADAMLLLGQSQLLADRVEESERTLKKFLDAHGSNKQADLATSLLGEARMRLGRRGEASTTFASLSEKWPRSAARERADLLWAMCESEAGQHARAAQIASSLRATFPASAMASQAMLIEAQSLHRLGDTEGSLALYRELTKAETPAIRSAALLGSAQLMRAAGKPADAARILESLSRDRDITTMDHAAPIELARCHLDLSDPEAALAVLAAMPAEPPSTLADDVTYWTARAEARAGKFAAAAARLASCEKRFAESELLAEMMYERADALSRDGRTADADASFQMLEQRFPSHSLAAEAAIGRAVAAYQAKDDDGAVRLSTAFLNEHGSHARAPTAALLIAECEYRAGRFDRAAKAYSDFVTRYPEDPNAKHAAVRLGACLAHAGDVTQSAAVLSAALSGDEGGDPALHQAAMVTLADAAFSAGDWKTAETWFTRVADTASAGEVREDALLKLGLSAHRQDDAARAAASYDKLLSEYPNGRHSAQATFERGQALVALQRDADAAVCFQRVIDQERNADDRPFTRFAVRHLAAVHLRAGEPDKAVDLLADIDARKDDAGGIARLHLERGLALLAANRNSDAEIELRVAAEAGGADADESRVHLAIALSRQERLAEALQLLDAALKKTSQASAPLRESARFERLSILRRLKRDDDFLHAVQEFLASVASNGLAAHANVELAHFHVAAGGYAEALRAVDAAEERTDGATRAALADHIAYIRGVSEHNLGRHDQAVKALAGLVAGNSSSPLRSAAAMVAGEAMLKTNRPSEAARLFKDLSVSTSDGSVAEAALLRFGEASAAAANWTASERAFTDFLARYPESPVWFQARFGIGWAAENQGRHDAAISAYQLVTATHDGPTAARAQFQIGECLFAMKRFDDAVKELLRVDILYTYPEWSAAALFEAGRCLAEQGKVVEARNQFSEVSSRFPDSKWAPLASAELARTKPAPLPGRDAAPSAPRKDRSR